MKPAPGGLLNGLGHSLLDAIDYRVSLLVGLLIVGGAVIIHKRMNGKWPDLIEVIRSAIGYLMISTAFTVFCVFFLTKPPYIEALEADGLSVTAFIVFLFMVGMGIAEVRRLIVKKAPTPSANPEPPKASE
jgi:hypothetical protein